MTTAPRSGGNGRKPQVELSLVRSSHTTNQGDSLWGGNSHRHHEENHLAVVYHWHPGSALDRSRLKILRQCPHAAHGQDSHRVDGNDGGEPGGASRMD